MEVLELEGVGGSLGGFFWGEEIDITIVGNC